MKNLLTKIGEIKLKNAERKQRFNEKLDNITKGYRESSNKAKAVKLQMLRARRETAEAEKRFKEIEKKELKRIEKAKKRDPSRSGRFVKKLAGEMKKNIKKNNVKRKNTFSNKIDTSVWSLGKK